MKVQLDRESDISHYPNPLPTYSTTQQNLPELGITN